MGVRQVSESMAATESATIQIGATSFLMLPVSNHLPLVDGYGTIPSFTWKILTVNTALELWTSVLISSPIVLKITLHQPSASTRLMHFLSIFEQSSRFNPTCYQCMISSGHSDFGHLSERIDLDVELNDGIGAESGACMLRKIRKGKSSLSSVTLR